MKGLDTLTDFEKRALIIPKVMLPCPFCGDEVFIGKHSYQKAYIVRCSSAGGGRTLFPSSGPLDFDELQIYINNWNIRH